MTLKLKGNIKPINTFKVTPSPFSPNLSSSASSKDLPVTRERPRLVSHSKPLVSNNIPNLPLEVKKPPMPQITPKLANPQIKEEEYIEKPSLFFIFLDFISIIGSIIAFLFVLDIISL